MIAKAPRDNDTIARQICEDQTLDGQRFACGMFVAIAEGRIIGAGRSFDEADGMLTAAGFGAGEGMICEVGKRDTDVIRRECLRCR
jgi:hypothetical protein